MWREGPLSSVLCCKLRWGRINQHIWCTHSLSKLNRCVEPLSETFAAGSWRRLVRVCCLVKHFLHKQHGVHQWAFLSVNQWIFWFGAFKLVNDPLDYCNIERRRIKAKFWSGVFAESVYKLINMNHKHLLSCCVEILDSFNPRIHGVLEHLNSCLATKQVSKIFSF